MLKPLKTLLSGVVIFCGFSGILFGEQAQMVVDAEKDRTAVSVPPMATPPTIDGKIESAEWRGAVKFAGGAVNTPISSSVIEPRLVNAYLGYDENNIYIAFQSELPKHGKLTANALNPKDVFRDDSVEIILNPKGKRLEGDLQFGYFQLAANSKGNTFFRHYEPGWGCTYWPWKPVIKQKHLLENGFWAAEFAIPVKYLGLGKITCPTEIGFVLARNFQNPRAIATFLPGNEFLNTNNHATLFCRKESPVVQISYPEWIKEYGKAVKATIYNPTEKSIKIKDSIEYLPGGENSGFEEFELGPGEMKTISRKCGLPEDNYQLNVNVNQENLPVYCRNIIFTPPPEKKWADIDSSTIFELDFSNNNFMPKFATGTEIEITGKPEIIKDKSGEAICHLPKGASLCYPKINVPVPGAVYCKIKLGTPPVKVKWRTIWSTFSEKGSFLLVESPNALELYLLEDDKAKYKIIWPKPKEGLGKFFTALVNLGEKKASMYINGDKVGEVSYPALPRLERFRIGATAPSSIEDFEIKQLKIFDRNFYEDEIGSLSLRDKIVSGELSYFPSLGQLVSDAAIDKTKLPASPSFSLKLQDMKGNVIKDYAINLDKDFFRSEKGELLLRKRFELPDLADGEYNTFIEIVSSELDSPIKALKRSFRTKKYEWANNKLGLSNTIVPPFTPLQVKDNEVSCLLKRYFIGNMGLPEKAIGDGSEILAGPVITL